MAAANRFRSAGFFDCLAIVHSVATDQAPARGLPGLPLHAGEQDRWGDAQGACEPQDGVDPGQPVTALKLAYLGSVEIGGKAERFLR
jgi:hypothetical protein